MKRWNIQKAESVENAKIDAFLRDIEEVCSKHSLTIGHEDGHGAFLVQGFDQHNIDWLREAHDDTGDFRE